jgi:steroid delta-isomerase-like uncharacterized protein
MGTDNVIRTQSDAFNRHDASAFAACYADNARIADPQFSEPLEGAAAIAKDVGDWFGSFPDIEARLTRTVFDGTHYAAEWSMSGTHKGPLITPEGHVPATGKPIRLVVVTIGRVGADGRIVEERRSYDLAGILSQIGLMQ